MSRRCNPIIYTDIVQCLANGLSTKQIALLFVKSPRTIESYISRLLWKYNANSQAHLVAIFLRSELIK